MKEKEKEKARERILPRYLCTHTSRNLRSIWAKRIITVVPMLHWICLLAALARRHRVGERIDWDTCLNAWTGMYTVPDRRRCQTELSKRVRDRQRPWLRPHRYGFPPRQDRIVDSIRVIDRHWNIQTTVSPRHDCATSWMTTVAIAAPWFGRRDRTKPVRCSTNKLKRIDSDDPYWWWSASNED